MTNVERATRSGSEAAVGDGVFHGEGSADFGDPCGVEAEGDDRATLQCEMHEQIERGGQVISLRSSGFEWWPEGLMQPCSVEAGAARQGLEV